MADDETIMCWHLDEDSCSPGVHNPCYKHVTNDGNNPDGTI